MRSTRLNQSGFEAVGVILALVIVAVIGFAGYTVMNKSADDKASVSTQSTGEPDNLKTQADLKKSDVALDASEAELDTNLDDGSLDADLESML